MAPSSETFQKIAEDAERNLNSYENKTGAHKTSANDEAGVDTRAANKFPGAEVRYGDDVNTNAGYNKRIPPEEGGELDARGRQTRGEHFEGGTGTVNGLVPQQPQQQGQEHGQKLRKPDLGNDIPSSSKPSGVEGRWEYELQQPPSDLRDGETMATGREAAQSNIASDKYVPHKSQYRGAEYRYAREEREERGAVMSAEGYEPPESVTEASRESARYQ